MGGNDVYLLNLEDGVCAAGIGKAVGFIGKIWVTFTMLQKKFETTKAKINHTNT